MDEADEDEVDLDLVVLRRVDLVRLVDGWGSDCPARPPDGWWERMEALAGPPR